MATLVMTTTTMVTNMSGECCELRRRVVGLCAFNTRVGVHNFYVDSFLCIFALSISCEKKSGAYTDAEM